MTRTGYLRSADGYSSSTVAVATFARDESVPWPVAITPAAHAAAIAWDTSHPALQDEATRTREVLRAAGLAMRRHFVEAAAGRTVFFQVWAIPNKPGTHGPTPVSLIAALGVDYDGATPALMVRLADEI